MASEIVQNSGPEDTFAEIDRLIELIESELPVVQGSTGPIEGDQQTRRILRILRMLRRLVGESMAKPAQPEGVDFGIYGGAAGEGPFINNEGREI